MMPAKATKVARPEQLVPAKATDESQVILDPNTSGPEQVTPATVVMNPED
jgi:hypothetical protein